MPVEMATFSIRSQRMCIIMGRLHAEHNITLTWLQVQNALETIIHQCFNKFTAKPAMCSSISMNYSVLCVQVCFYKEQVVEI